MAEDIATHEEPVRRNDANFLIFADLARHGMTGRWEQLWARQITENEFRLCCIPFFTYGLALGDRVTTKASGDKKYVIQSTVAASGHIAYQIWFGDVVNAASVREAVQRYAKSKGWLMEWSSENLLALDIPSERDEIDLRAFLTGHADSGVTFESGA
jgi:hypothetical protein